MLHTDNLKRSFFFVSSGLRRRGQEAEGVQASTSLKFARSVRYATGQSVGSDDARGDAKPSRQEGQIVGGTSKKLGNVGSRNKGFEFHFM
jgi:hypothetical protein